MRWLRHRTRARLWAGIYVGLFDPEADTDDALDESTDPENVGETEQNGGSGRDGER